MCLNTRNLKPELKALRLKITKANLIKCAVKTAKRNKIVYKLFYPEYNGQLRTPFQGYLWPSIDPPAVSLAIKKDGDALEITRGFHAYRTEQKAVNAMWGARKVYRMIIPKGADYIIGNDGDIVATQMRLATKQDINGPKRKPAKASKRKVVSKRKKK